jgi:hypothetical protein
MQFLSLGVLEGGQINGEEPLGKSVIYTQNACFLHYYSYELPATKDQSTSALSQNVVRLFRHDDGSEASWDVTPLLVDTV